MISQTFIPVPEFILPTGTETNEANAETETQPVRSKKTLVSENAHDEKNLRPGGRKFIFFTRLPEGILFSFSSFCFFCILAFFC